MNKYFSVLDKKNLGQYFFSKVSLIAFNYFLIELNKTYKPNLSISSLVLDFNLRCDNYVELIIWSNDEKMNNRICQVEDCINEIFYLYYIFEKFQLKIRFTKLNENKLIQLTFNNNEKKFKVETFLKDTDNYYTEFRLLVDRNEFLDLELEFIIIFLRKLHCFNFHLNFIVKVNNRELLYLQNFSFIIPTVNLISEYFDKRVNISSNFQYFYNSQYLNFKSAIDKDVFYDCVIVFHKLSKKNFLELSLTFDRKISIKSIKGFHSIMKKESFEKLIKKIGILEIISQEEINFEKVEIKTINDHSIGVFININNVDLDIIEENSIYEDILKFLHCSFDRIKNENQFICPNNKEKKNIKVFKKDITVFSNSIISMYSMIALKKNNSYFQNKFDLFIGENRNLDNIVDLFNNYFYKNGFSK